MATQPRFDPERWQIAKILLAAGWKGLVTLDREELRRVAGSSDYRVGPELERMILEIEASTSSGNDSRP